MVFSDPKSNFSLVLFREVLPFMGLGYLISCLLRKYSSSIRFSSLKRTEFHAFFTFRSFIKFFKAKSNFSLVFFREMLSFVCITYLFFELFRVVPTSVGLHLFFFCALPRELFFSLPQTVSF
jgi:hypothetical protein